MLDELKKEKNTTDTEKLVCVKTDGSLFDTFKKPLEFASNIYHEYNPRNLDKIKSQEEALINAENLYNNRNNAIKAFEDGVFPFNNGLLKMSQICPIKHYQIG